MQAGVGHRPNQSISKVFTRCDLAENVFRGGSRGPLPPKKFLSNLNGQILGGEAPQAKILTAILGQTGSAEKNRVT